MLEAIYLTISPGHIGKSYDPFGTHAVNMKYLIMILVAMVSNDGLSFMEIQDALIIRHV